MVLYGGGSMESWFASGWTGCLARVGVCRGASGVSVRVVERRREGVCRGGVGITAKGIFIFIFIYKIAYFIWKYM